MHKKTSFMLGIILLIFLIPFVYADEVKTFNVDAGYEQIFTLDLNEGMKIDGSMSITGGSGNDVDFWITDPVGNKIVDLGRVSQGTQFEFTANQDGAHSLHFDNAFSILSNKNIVLTYNITISGMDGSQLLILAFLVIAVIAVGIVVILKRGRNNRSEPNF